MFADKKNTPPVVLLIILVSLVFTASMAIYAVADARTLSSNSLTGQNNLPVVGSVDNLKKLLQETGDYGWYSPLRSSKEILMADEALENKVKAVSESGNFSDTNTQVQGVDEADIIKTDGKYIYQVTRQEVRIIKANPATEMQVISHIQFDEKFNPLELHISDKHLVVLGNSSLTIPYPPRPVSMVSDSICPPPNYNLHTTKAIIYNIENRGTPSKIREVELEGRYLSSRKIASSLYFVTSKNINYHCLENDSLLLPSYRDTAAGQGLVNINCDKIRYFPDNIYPAYILAAGVNLDTPEENADIQTYLGNGENIYASPTNLYIAVSGYHKRPVFSEKKLTAPAAAPSEASTSIYKFALNKGKVFYAGKSEVPGNILNQFSMDEYNGYFRIATTSGDMWRDDRYTSKNNIYILDNTLNLAGSLTGIAPGERIYSTRFMGNRAYMVTFRDTDPFFVIDLSNAANPQILGKLKIPGYSNYLHPYDENHIIGFGKDTIEGKGWNNQPQAYYQGMKLAVFDVTDVNNPLEMHKTIIGARGTDSELLNNHKALLFSREKKLLAFPVTVMELNNDEQNLKRGYIPSYGSFAFQGAYIYNIDLVKGFRLKGGITHLTPEDYQRAGDYWYGSDRNIERILYIGDILYTLSPDIIKAHNMTDLKEVKTLYLNSD